MNLGGTWELYCCDETDVSQTEMGSQQEQLLANAAQLQADRIRKVAWSKENTLRLLTFIIIKVIVITNTFGKHIIKDNFVLNI